MEYTDLDGDNITLASELDVENMMDTTTSKYLKVSVVPGDYNTNEFNV